MFNGVRHHGADPGLLGAQSAAEPRAGWKNSPASLSDTPGLVPVAELPGHATLMVCHWFLGSLLGNTLNGFAWWQCDLLDAAQNELAGGVDFHTGFLPDLPGTRARPQHFLSESQYSPASQST